MVSENQKNKFSVLKNKSVNAKPNKNHLALKDNVLVNILDNPSNYTISIKLKGLSKDIITLSYINNFLVIDFKFKGSEFSSLNYKRTFYLKDIDISKIQKQWSLSSIYITLPKKI